MYKLYPHQTDLVNRTRMSYIQGFKSPCVVSPCGSGKSVIIADIVKSATDKGNRVLFLIHRKELQDQITNTFKGYGVDMSLVDVSMVQTIVRKLDKISVPRLIVTDENHHSLADTYKKIYKYFKNVPRLGFTATPIRLNGSGLGDVNDVLIIGPSVKWLIDNNFLAPFKYYAPEIIDTKNFKIVRGEYKVNEITINKTIYGDILKIYERLSKDRQAICYCPNVEFSKEIKNRFSESGITAEHLDAKTNKKTRGEIIEKFRTGEIKILCNVDLIGEGFDVPDCETVILLRPTASLSLFIQQSMRSMRYKPNKTAIIIDCVGNVERFGLPSFDREWELNPVKEKKNKNKMENGVKTCPDCFATISTEFRICPECGFEFKVEIEEDKSIELKELKESDFEFNYTMNTKHWRECKSMKELQIWCKDNGYKRGYAYFLGKELNFIK